jgi:hypothetical protein
MDFSGFAALIASKSDISSGSQTVLQWIIAGSIILVLLALTTYRAITRTFHRGPDDT